MHRCRTLSTASYTSRHCYELEKLSQNASRTKHTVMHSAQIKFRGAAPPTKYSRLTGWFAHRLTPGDGRSHAPERDPEALEAADLKCLNLVVRRYVSLRAESGSTADAARQAPAELRKALLGAFSRVCMLSPRPRVVCLRCS